MDLMDKYHERVAERIKFRGLPIHEQLSIIEERSNESNAIILKESIRFRADNKKSSPRKIRTALNVILSNCTNSRTFSRDVYGDCFCLQCPKVTFLSDKL